MKTKKRILFIGPTYISSTTQERIQNIREMGSIETGLLSPKKWKSKDYKSCKMLEKGSSHIEYFPSGVLLNGMDGGHIYNPITVFKAIKKFKPDLIYFDQEVFSLSAFEMAIFSKFFSIPLVAVNAENIMDKKLSFIRKWTRKFVLETAKAIRIECKGGEYCLRNWGYKGHLALIPFEIDTKKFYPTRDKKKEFVIGYIGRLTYKKGLDVFLKAAQKLKKENFQFKVVIVGEGPEKNKLKALSKYLDIENIVSWKDTIEFDKVPEVMRNFNAFVLPSRAGRIWKEQFGRVIIEAMASGVPVIGTTSGSIPEVIGRNDMLFPEDHDEKLAEIIKKLMNDKKFKREIAEYNIKRAEKEISVEPIDFLDVLIK